MRTQLNNPYSPNYYSQEYPSAYENFNQYTGMRENFQNIFSNKFVEFFKESFTAYDKTDQLLQIVIVILFVLFFIQLTDIIFN